MDIKLSQEDIQTMNLFENMARVSVVDYMKKEDGLYFVVECSNMRDLIGEGGENIKRLQSKFGQNIKVFKYSTQIKEFLEGVLSVPVKSFEMTDAGAKKSVKFSVDAKDKPMAIGRQGKTIKLATEFLQRNFGITDVKLM
jgi:NusA-like KH domain protein